MRTLPLYLLVLCSIAWPNFSPSYKGSLGDQFQDFRNEHPLKAISNTKAFPYRAVGRLRTGCTGTLITSKHVLTAAHCVYSMDQDIYYKELQFSPGKKGQEEPFGEVDWKSVIAPKEWTQKHDEDFDYALITLKKEIGNEVGWLGYGVAEQLIEKNIRITGYPGHKPFGTMWSSHCAPAELNPFWIHYECETAGGMSGSGVVYNTPQETHLVVGVHALGGSDYNSGVRITPEVYRQILGWTEAD